MVRFKVCRARRRSCAVAKESIQNRWLLVSLLTSNNEEHTDLNSKQIYNALKQSVLTNFGEVGWGCVAASLNGTISLLFDIHSFTDITV